MVNNQNLLGRYFIAIHNVKKCYLMDIISMCVFYKLESKKLFIKKRRMLLNLEYFSVIVCKDVQCFRCFLKYAHPNL